MTKLLEIPLRDVTPETIQALQHQYPDATVRIETAEKMLP